MAKLSKYKDYDIVGAWTKSITNHMYWCTTSAPDGDGKEMVTCRKSLMRHLCDNRDESYHLPWVIEEENGSHQVMMIQIFYMHPYIFAITSQFFT